MTLQALPPDTLRLSTLANACHDLADRYLVRFIEAQDLGDQPGAGAAWKRYQQYWQAETLALAAGDGEPLPPGLLCLLQDPAIADELAQALGAPLPV